MPVLVLPPRYTPDSIAVAGAAARAGWQVERLPGWRVPPWLTGQQDVVLYGEPLFAAVVAEPLNLPLLGPPPDWLARLPFSLRGRRVRYATLGEARRLSGAAFVKPADDKCFAAGVYNSGERLPCPDVLPDATPVLIAEVVYWEVEYRCFVLDRTVTTSSPYLRGGVLSQAAEGTWPAPPAESAEALAFAGAVLADAAVLLPPAVVLDVGKIAGQGWAVVEANAAWGSGVYGCDPARVLPVIQRSCVPKDNLADEGRRWVVASGTISHP